MIVKNITDYLEKLAPLAYAENFDNVGLLIGNYNKKITGVLVVLDTLENTIDEAIDKKCNLIISFHPIIFKGLKSITGNNYVERVVIKAIKNDIAIYTMHTALDNSSQGVSAKMCEILGLTNTNILVPQKGNIKKLTTYVPHKNADSIRNSLFEAGAGNIGNYDNCSFNIEGTGTYQGNENSNPTLGKKGTMHAEPETFISVIFEKHLESKILNALFKNHPYEEVAYDVVTLDNEHHEIGMGMVGELNDEMAAMDFLKFLKQKFNLETLRFTDLNNKKIKKVAVLGGSGSFAISPAKLSGADIYITSDLKYHDFLSAENQIILVDIGHYESEQFTKNLIVDYLTNKFTNFAIILSEKNTNPINHL